MCYIFHTFHTLILIVRTVTLSKSCFFEVLVVFTTLSLGLYPLRKRAPRVVYIWIFLCLLNPSQSIQSKLVHFSKMFKSNNDSIEYRSLVRDHTKNGCIIALKSYSSRVHIPFRVPVHPAVWAVVALLLVVAAMAAAMVVMWRRQVNTEATIAIHGIFGKITNWGVGAYLLLCSTSSSTVIWGYSEKKWWFSLS